MCAADWFSHKAADGIGGGAMVIPVTRASGPCLQVLDFRRSAVFCLPIHPHWPAAHVTGSPSIRDQLSPQLGIDRNSRQDAGDARPCAFSAVDISRRKPRWLSPIPNSPQLAGDFLFVEWYVNDISAAFPPQLPRADIHDGCAKTRRFDDAAGAVAHQHGRIAQQCQKSRARQVAIDCNARRPGASAPGC